MVRIVAFVKNNSNDRRSDIFRFKYKYHPDEYPKRREEQRQIVRKRLEIFMDLHGKGYLNDVSVDIENQRALTRFLEAGM